VAFASEEREEFHSFLLDGIGAEREREAYRSRIQSMSREGVGNDPVVVAGGEDEAGQLQNPKKTAPASARWKAALLRALELAVRHASLISMLLYLTGSLGGLLALTSAGRPGGVDEKAFTLGVVMPQLGATKTADVMRLYHLQKDAPTTGSMLGDVRAMWNECEAHWHRSEGRRHGLAWYEIASDPDGARRATANVTQDDAQNYTGRYDVVYDVVEATRADGTESVLLVVPLGDEGMGTGVRTGMGVAVGHGLAWYLQEQEWLAKNAVVTYVDVSKSSVETAVAALLERAVDRRIGHIGQAVVLDLRVAGEGEGEGDSSGDNARNEGRSSVSIKVHGWNGRLPNLDLFVLARKLAESYVTAGPEVTVHGASTLADSTWNKGLALARFVSHHGFGLADGGHGALLDRGIDALTVELSFPTTNANLKGVLQMADALVRELNNLHERLHHATGLYALAGAGVVIDIGMYTVCPAMLAVACALKAYQLSCSKGGEDAVYVTWNQAVRWVVGLLCAAAALYANGHIMAASRLKSSTLLSTSSTVSPSLSSLLPSPDVLATCAVAFCRIALFGVVMSELFIVRGVLKHEEARNVRWDAFAAWALCGVSVFLILYRWSLAWMLLTAFLPVIVTRPN